jgi:serine/threonine protein phosphatase PrpC
VIADYITREVIIPALQSGQFADQDTLAARLKGAIEAANLALVGSNEQTGSDMGSTVTGALIVGDTAHIVNVGDSRTYLFDTNTLQPISVDHSLVMQLVIGGLIERDAIYTHPQRNQILRSLGDRRDVQIDLFTQKLRPGYQLVICCDGLWEMVRDPQIEQVLRETTDPQAAADRLVELANQSGGEDNISVIIVQARE